MSIQASFNSMLGTLQYGLGFTQGIRKLSQNAEATKELTTAVENFWDPSNPDERVAYEMENNPIAMEAYEIGEETGAEPVKRLQSEIATKESQITALEDRYNILSQRIMNANSWQQAKKVKKSLMKEDNK